MRNVRLTGVFRPSEEPNVGRMCFVGPDLWGVELEAEINGHLVRLALPERSSSDGYNGRMGDSSEHPLGLSVRYFTADLEWSLDTSDPDTERASWRDAAEVLRAAATRLTNALRLVQPSSGLAGDTPHAEKLSAVDITTGEAVPVGVPVNRSPPFIVGQPVADRQLVERSLRGDMQVPEILLAQAAYWVRSTADPKYGLGVVLLAMALETKARRVLTDCATPEVEPLLTVLFEKGNIFQQSAYELFGHVANAVIGRSLRSESSQLFKRVEKVFQLRNAMAHRGSEPTRQEVGPLVVAAYEAFHWLDDVRGAVAADSETPETD